MPREEPRRDSIRAHRTPLRDRAVRELPPPELAPQRSMLDPVQRAADWSFQPAVAELQVSGEAYRRHHDVRPACLDAVRCQLLIVDAQRDFCHPRGTLFVGGRSGRGATDDLARLVGFIYRNLEQVTEITCTLDTHLPFQIFFPSFWRQRDGGAATAHRRVRLADVRAGELVPNPEIAWWLCDGDLAWLQRQVEFYCQTLEASGRYELYLWPAHCLLGGDGHALMGALQEARLFHSFVRASPAPLESKGAHALTENYSVLAPEVLLTHDHRPLGERNEPLIDRLLTADVLIVAGQAASHCVRSSLDDLLEVIGERDPALATRIYVLADCMSAVVVRDPERPGEIVADFTAEVDAALERYRRAGVNVVESTSPLSEWPGRPWG